MQQFDPGNPNSLSPQEAQEILATWANRRQAQEIDPAVNSVAALASGLGVSEEEVRQMLEDIRVHKRSQQIAAGILDHQQKERKRSDVNAAIIATVVLAIIVVVGLAIYYFNPFRSYVRPPDTTVPPAEHLQIDIPPIAPVMPAVGPGLGKAKLIHAGTDGHVITFTSNSLTDVSPNGNITNLSDQAAIDYANEKIKALEPRIKDLGAKKDPSDADKKELNNLQGELDTYKGGINLLKKNKS